ncbi:hypothetical protein K466DRAFT_552414 [Polyporus arcularius HHB13444]|uniref:Uncharacterized protein n=1 Tax=Polyporus arcularius HHB13444 TaxID=1314778 RepID=A0A5C3P6G9_9APHY|nr:hypothetical protein K466DRAFT_552414 [Polyporus arcularius HHB13444]
MSTATQRHLPAVPTPVFHDSAAGPDMSVHPRGLRRKPARTNLSRSKLSVSRDSTSAEVRYDQVQEPRMTLERVRPVVPSDRPTMVGLALRSEMSVSRESTSAEERHKQLPEIPTEPRRTSPTAPGSRPAAVVLAARPETSISGESTSAEEDPDQVPELGMAPARGRPAAPSRTPTAVVIAFRQLGFNVMIASSIPGAGEGMQRMRVGAQYHILVHMNCFCPSSFVTVVRRGAADGELVGSFEMGISTQRATVNMYGVEKHVDTVLSREGKKAADRIWQWNWGDVPQHSICWHRESPVRYCYFMGTDGRPNGPMAAAFTCSSSIVGPDGMSPQPASLKVYPHGLRALDHIVVSALLVERKRLTPSLMGFHSIFN